MGSEVTRLADGFSFIESPSWHAGALYLSDFYRHRVLMADHRGRHRTVCKVSGQPSGLGWDREGRLLVVSMTDRKLLRLDGSRLTEVADLASLAPYQCNDMVVDDQGRAYIGNFGSDAEVAGTRPTCLILVEPDGSARVAADDLIFPNGMAITPDGQTCSSPRPSPTGSPPSATPRTAACPRRVLGRHSARRRRSGHDDRRSGWIGPGRPGRHLPGRAGRAVGGRRDRNRRAACLCKRRAHRLHRHHP